MKINTKPVQPAVFTHGGAKTSRISAETELRRTVMACLLWEDSFYESGVSVADRIKDLVPKCRPDFVAACAFHARTAMKLRHVPLLLVAHMTYHAEHKKLVSALLRDVIQRPDEITEFVAIYKAIGSRVLSAQVKKGLAAAFAKFDEYSLAKYNRDGAWKLRDALFLSHAKPKDAQGITKVNRQAVKDTELNPHEQLYKRLVDGTLEVPNTWEVRLSGGEDKKDVFTDLMLNKQLGALAFIRNLRNMIAAGVDESLMREYSKEVKVDRVLPYQFLTAARYAPRMEDALEQMMFRCMEGIEKLPGKTIFLVDVSGSMDEKLSSKGDMKRTDAAYGLAILGREMCEESMVFTFSRYLIEMPAGRRGMALRDAMDTSQLHHATYLGASVRSIDEKFEYDRIIVITDEQSNDVVPNPKGRGYMINVANYKHGVGYGGWMKIDGFSEAVMKYIVEFEKFENEVLA